MKNIPILILHGWNLSAGKFIPLQEEFKNRGYKVYCPDLPGFGKTEFPQKPLFLSDYVNFVEEFLQKNKLRSVIIIGHSFGGRIGIKYASQNPKLLKALILTGAPGYNPVPRFRIIFFLALAKIGNTILALPILKNIRAISRHLLYKAARATDFYHTEKKMRDTFKNIVKEDLSMYLPLIKTPTLLLWGKNDLIVPLYIGERMKKTIPNVRLVSLSDARHGVPWTHPKAFADEVEKFLNKVTP